MDQGIKNMSAEQLRELVLEQQAQVTGLEQNNQILTKERDQLGQQIDILEREKEDQIAWYKKAIEGFEKKVRIIEDRPLVKRVIKTGKSVTEPLTEASNA